MPENHDTPNGGAFNNNPDPPNGFAGGAQQGPGAPPPPPPGGWQQQQAYGPPPGWYWHNNRWYNTPMAEDGTWLVRDDRTMAMLAHLLTIFTGFIGPLVIYIIKKDQSRFVAFHALQALYFSIAVAVASIIAAISMLIMIGFCLLPALGIGALIYPIILALKANEGRWDKYWLVGEWAASSTGYPYQGGMNQPR